MLFAMLIKTARLQSHYCFYLMVPIAILFNVLIGYGINVHVSKKPEKNQNIIEVLSIEYTNARSEGRIRPYVYIYVYIRP
jgi:hypothetical protein